MSCEQCQGCLKPFRLRTDAQANCQQGCGLCGPTHSYSYYSYSAGGGECMHVCSHMGQRVSGSGVGVIRRAELCVGACM